MYNEATVEEEKVDGELRASGPWIFPVNPDELLPELPRDEKGRIYPSDNIRIRPEQHDMKPNETYNPRHHGQHYHVDTKPESSYEWKDNKNFDKQKPPGYTPGSGTGFVPGEYFPGVK